MRIFAYMECGAGKTVSEDTVLIGDRIVKEGYAVSEDDPRCVMVADGVGGNAGGREASEYVAAMVRRMGEDDLLRAARQINDGLIAYAGSIPGKERMATTCSSLFFRGGKPSRILHVGNTRISAIQGAYLKQLTPDHTTAAWLRAQGQHEAAELAPANEITACFGAGDPARLRQITVIDIDKTFFGYVLTSDGLHDYLEPDDLEDFTAEKDFSPEAFSALAAKAAALGSSDDKSIIVICMRE